MTLLSVITILAILSSTYLVTRLFNLNWLLALLVTIGTEYIGHIVLRLFGADQFTSTTIALIACFVLVFYLIWYISPQIWRLLKSRKP